MSGELGEAERHAVRRTRSGGSRRCRPSAGRRRTRPRARRGPGRSPPRPPSGGSTPSASPARQASRSAASRTSRTCPCDAARSRNSRAASAPTSRADCSHGDRRRERDVVAAGVRVISHVRRRRQHGEQPGGEAARCARGTVIVAVSSLSSASSAAPVLVQVAEHVVVAVDHRSHPRDRTMPGVDRLARAAAAAAAAGLDGLLVAPGPDLRYLTGYTPLSAAERLMVLVVRRDEDPVLVLPGVRAPRRAGRPGLRRVVGRRGPVRAAADCSAVAGACAVSDAAWALHVLALQSRCLGRLVRLDDCRAAAAARDQGHRRAGAHGAPARPRDAAFADAARRAVRRPHESSTWRGPRAAAARARPRRASTSRSSAPARTAPTRTTARGSA